MQRFVLASLVLLSVAAGCESRSKSPPEQPPVASTEPERSAPADEHGSLAADVQEEFQRPVEVPAALDAPRAMGKLAPAPGPVEQVALERLAKWVKSKGGKLHATLLDLEEQSVVVAHRPSEPVNPASNMKLLTAAAALELLGPTRTLRTELRGDLDASGVTRPLVLVGGGDPSLGVEELVRLVRAAKARGLSEVDGIVVDQSRFDEHYLPPAYDQQPHEWAPFRAPISALSVEQNAVTLNVEPTAPGEAARVWYEPPGVVARKGSVRTSEGSADRVAWSLDPNKDPAFLESTVSGSLGRDAGRRRYSRRLEDPRAAGGHVLAALLLELGVRVKGSVAVVDASARPQEQKSLAFLTSAPLAALLDPVGKDSDNFTAETLFVALSSADDKGREDARLPWSSARGAARTSAWLGEVGIPTAGTVVRNGSGLFDANRLTVEVLALVLAHMEARADLFPEYLTQLAVYGRDGTLARRGRGMPNHARVRAKTGTLNDIDALSGYILRDGKRPLAFSVIISGLPGAHGETRQQVDRLILDWSKRGEAPR